MVDRDALAREAARWPDCIKRDHAAAQRMTGETFTWPERALLMSLPGITSDFLAVPDVSSGHHDDGTQSGGGSGFQFRCTTTALVGTWHEFTPVDWFPNGEPKRWEDGALLGEAKVTYRRLVRWSESMPASIRVYAHMWHRLYPVNTSDPRALTALTVSLLCDPAPTPAPLHEPVDLLELLEMTNA